MTIPLLSDLNKTISKSFGVLVEDETDGMNGISLRGTFIIDDKGKLRHSSINDASVGRNVEETLRLLTAFQYADTHGEVCPAKWSPGKKAMDASHTSDKTSSYWKDEHATKH
jgi:alkyl hydroperoxide reductase subunit AhpC